MAAPVPEIMDVSSMTPSNKRKESQYVQRHAATMIMHQKSKVSVFNFHVLN
jgi:hypothetical protein